MGGDPSVRDILGYAGECARCKEQVRTRTPIALVPGNSGPGYTVWGCIPCAKLMASFTLASDWLRKNVERLTKAGL